MTVNQQTIDLIKNFESLHDGDLSVIGLQPKMCPAGIWTVGYGHALTGSNGKFLEGDKDKEHAYFICGDMTVEEAESLLREDLKYYNDQVTGALTRKPAENQFGAMVSLCFNIGVGNFKTSSVLRNFNSGHDKTAADSFLLWVKATVNGKKVVLRGLQRRRIAEQELFVS